MSLFIAGTCFFPINYFVDSFIYPKVILYCITGIIISMLYILFYSGNINVSPVICYVIIFLLYLVFRIWHIRPIWIISVITSIILLLVFCNLSFEFSAVFVVIEFFSVVIIAIFAMQKLNILSTNNLYLASATFDNPSGFSVVLSLNFPFVLHRFLMKFRFQELILLILIIMSLLFVKSRSGIVTIIIVCGFMLCIIYNYWKPSKRSIFACICIGLSIFFILLWLKSDSTLGRFFIYWQSLKLVSKYLFLGGGFYGFTSQYMKTQADYFNHNSESMFENFAGQIMHPLNEYIAIVIDFGIVAILLLILIIWQILKNWDSRRIIIYSYFLSVFIQSLFTYTFRYPYVWFTMLFCLSLLAREPSKTIKFTIPLRSITFFACILMTYGIVKDVRFESEWYNAMKDNKNKLLSYQQLEKNWSGNPFFLYNFAAVLYCEMEYEKSNLYLNKYSKYVADYNAELMMAENYYSLGDYENACHYFNYAHFMCPSYFMPLRGLLRTYKKISRLHEADIIADMILRKKTKIDSYTVRAIKTEANKYIESRK